jgi:hypothetical protein
MMSNPNWSRSLVFGIATVFALTLLAPLAVTVSAQEEVAVLAPIVASSVDETNVEAGLAAAHVLAAQHALQSQDLGSMQEEALRIIVATGTAQGPVVEHGDLPGGPR